MNLKRFSWGENHEVMTSKVFKDTAELNNKKYALW